MNGELILCVMVDEKRVYRLNTLHVLALTNKRLCRKISEIKERLLWMAKMRPTNAAIRKYLQARTISDGLTTVMGSVFTYCPLKTEFERFVRKSNKFYGTLKNLISLRDNKEYADQMSRVHFLEFKTWMKMYNEPETKEKAELLMYKRF